MSAEQMAMKKNLIKYLLGGLCILFFVLLAFRPIQTGFADDRRQRVVSIGPNLVGYQINWAQDTKTNPRNWIQPASVNWTKVLHFIPDKKNEDCLTLFTTPTSVHQIKSLEYGLYVEYFRKLNDRSTELSSLKHRPAPQHEKLTLTYQALANEPWVKTVCEIGFDQGHSALAWLTAKQDLILHSFDIGLLEKTPHLASFLKTLFKDRFQFHFGNSEMTIPLWAVKLRGQCDIVSIDGGHQFTQCLHDFIHMRGLAARKHMIVADDIEYPDVKKAWMLLKQLGIVTEQYRCHINGVDIDFVLGQYSEVFWET